MNQQIDSISPALLVCVACHSCLILSADIAEIIVTTSLLDLSTYLYRFFTLYEDFPIFTSLYYTVLVLDKLAGIERADRCKSALPPCASYNLLKVYFMSFRYPFIIIIIAALSFTENNAINVIAQKSDSCWNRIKVTCGGNRKKVSFHKDQSPGIPLSDYAKIDSLGVITEEQFLSDTISLIVKKHTFWGTNANTNSVERKISAIDSITEKVRLECEYAGPGKGTCSSCQVTDCNGLPLGPLKTGKSIPNK